MPEVTVILHNIRSTYNVGSIFRTAEGLGVTNIIISGYTPYPAYTEDKRLPHIAIKQTEQIRKTALGAETMVPFERVDDIHTWIKDNNGMHIVALEQTPTSVPLPDFSAPQKFALLLGEEVHGIGGDLLRACDSTVEIPMQGQKESFNVSVAAAICLYEILGRSA